MTDDTLFSEDSKLVAGSNIFELIEFSLERRLADGRIIKGTYGVNVAKVREVVRLPSINPLASRIDGVAGVFELRGIPVPAINLARVLGDKDAPITPSQQIIVTEFSGRRAGFIVTQTHRIRRVAWEKVLPPSGGSEASITGMTLIEDNGFLFILDLEKIINDIELASCPASNGDSQHLTTGLAKMAEDETASGNALEGMPSIAGLTVMFVDDSKIVMNYARTVLRKAGAKVVEATDGKQAFDLLTGTGGRTANVDIVVTDVEMPRMDGLTLTRSIRADARFQALPVILHTSLSSYSIKEASQSVGANGLIVKNDWVSLMEMIRKIVSPEKLLRTA